MKKRIITSWIMIAMMAIMVQSVSAVSTGDTKAGDTILYEYTQEELDSIVFTMDLFNSTFTREDVAEFVALEKASKAELTHEYRRFSASESEIDDFYVKMEELAARGPALSYYFSNVYWRERTDSYYGAKTISLTLIPTNIIKDDQDQNHRTAAWTLVKSECEDSKYWTNEASIQKQFDCHYMGEVLASRGVIEAVGDWDLEPIRPNYASFVFVVNRCNPTG